MGNLRTVKNTNRCTSIYECNFIVLCPQVCFANNVVSFSVERKWIQIYLQCVRISTQSSVHRTVRWFDRHTVLQLMAAFGLSCFSFVFLTAQVDFACWTLSSLISSQFRALVRWTKFVKKTTNALGFKNEILLHSDNRRVSATHVTIFRVEISRHFIIMYYYFSIHTDAIKRNSIKQNCMLKFHF